MKSAFSVFLIFFLYQASSAQLKRPLPPQKKIHSLRLACPVPCAVVETPSSQGYGYKGDVKVILKNVSDSLFLSPVEGKVDLVTLNAEGKYDIVMHYFNYNIWFTGIAESLVKKNDILKIGQPVGRIQPGDDVELLLFDDEDPVDPRKFLDCTDPGIRK